MLEFINNILYEEYKNSAENIFNSSPLLQYLDSKMNAVYGNSKTRRSLANIYAIYSILNFYVDDFYNQKDKYKHFQGYSYQELFLFCRNLYGGKKLQNHALNNRVNGEFKNKVNDKDLIIVNNGKYALHIDFLYVNGIDISKTVIKIIQKYIQLLQEKDNIFINDLHELKKLQTQNLKLKKLNIMLSEESEARVFEIISYAILKNHYKNIKIYWGYTAQDLQEEFLTLYKTGRTNANDGGIDFVMKPLGRFFQVTESTENYDKYFLDIDKVMHFPITFVVKTFKTKSIIEKELNDYIQYKSGGMNIIINKYKNTIEEIITINELKEWMINLSDNDISDIVNDIEIYYNLEMNLI